MIKREKCFEFRTLQDGVALMLVGMMMLVGVCFLQVGCASTEKARFKDPYGVMMDREADYPDRLAAFLYAERRWAASPLHVKKLQELIKTPGMPDRFYEMAVAGVLRYDEGSGRDFLRHQLPLLKHEEAVRPILVAVTNGRWEDFTAVLIGLAAEHHAHRADGGVAELNALGAIHPGKRAEDVAWAMFTGKIEAVDRLQGHSGHQMASAWALTAQLAGEGSGLGERLMAIELGNTLVEDLQFVYERFEILPETVEEIIWARSLNTPKYEMFTARAVNVYKGLSVGQRRGLKLRHLGVMVYMADHHEEMFSVAHADLAELLRNKLRDADTFDSKSYADDKAKVELINLGKLSTMDLMTVWLAVGVVEHADVKGVLFAQAELDRETTNTELGGLIKDDGEGGLDAKLYAPELRVHDLAYVAPLRLIDDGYGALFHYHFHAQRHDNAAYAGPGAGDLKTIGARQKFNGLVITFIDSKRMNVDYYQAGPVVIDLGIIEK